MNLNKGKINQCDVSVEYANGVTCPLLRVTPIPSDFMRETIQTLRDNLNRFNFCPDVRRAIQSLDALLAKPNFSFDEAYLPTQEGGQQLLRWEQHTHKTS